MKVGIVQIQLPADRVEDHVLQDGPEAVGGGVDLGLVLRAQADDLGVAPALDVEDPHVGPPVLVVADEMALGVGGEGGLPRAGEAEEEGRVSVRRPRWRSSAWRGRRRWEGGSSGR